MNSTERRRRRRTTTTTKQPRLVCVAAGIALAPRTATATDGDGLLLQKGGKHLLGVLAPAHDDGVAGCKSVFRSTRKGKHARVNTWR